MRRDEGASRRVKIFSNCQAHDVVLFIGHLATCYIIKTKTPVGQQRVVCGAQSEQVFGFFLLPRYILSDCWCFTWLFIEGK